MAAATALAAGDGGRQPFTQEIPGTTVTIDLVPVPGPGPGPGRSDDGAEGALKPFWIGRTEITWDVYDIFVYGLDQRVFGADAVVCETQERSAP
jgi:hypothetical protein